MKNKLYPNKQRSGMNKNEKIYHEIGRKLAFGLLYPNVGLIYFKDLCCILQSDLPNKDHNQIYCQASKYSIKILRIFC